MFPIIKHIDDVLPFVKDNPSFVVLDRGDYKAIDYVIAFGKTFPSPDEDPNWSIYRECRGLIFDVSGKLVSRPLRKVFNLGEKPKEDQFLDWSEAKVTEKLDGSMVRPVMINDRIRMATRKGVTDVATQSEVFLTDKPNYYRFFEECLDRGITPVFEWCSRQNRIVIDHPEERLVLLSARSLRDGLYMSRVDLEQASEQYNIPLVQERPLSENVEEFLEIVKNLKDEEGVVVSFPDGKFVKIKADNYCQLHRTKSYFDSEHQVIQCIKDNTLDDLYPLLTVPQKARLSKYLDTFHNTLMLNVEFLKLLLEKCLPYLDNKKTYAVEFVNKQDPKWRPILFALWEMKFDLYFVDMYSWLLTNYVKCNSNKQVDETRWLFGAIWEK